jgi:tetratricopeptide (TPR) repeat protein
MLIIIITLSIIAGISFAFSEWQTNKEDISIKPQTNHTIANKTNTTNQENTVPIKEEKPNPDDLLNKGIEAYNQGNYKDAEELFSQAGWEYLVQNDYLRNHTLKDSFLLPDDVIPVWRKVIMADIYTIYSEWQQLLKLQPTTEGFINLNNKLFLTINTFQDNAPLSLEFNLIKALIIVNAPAEYKPNPPNQIQNTQDFVLNWLLGEFKKLPFNTLNKDFLDSFKKNLSIARNAYNNSDYQTAAQILNKAFSNYSSIVASASYAVGINIENILAGDTILTYTSFAYYNAGDVNHALVYFPHYDYMNDTDRNTLSQLASQMQEKTFKAPKIMPNLAPLILPSLP